MLHLTRVKLAALVATLISLVVVTAGTPALAAAKTPSSVTISLGTTSARVDDSTVVSGIARPYADTTRRVVSLQVARDGRWVTLTTTRADYSGRYSIGLSFASAGTFSYRALVASTRRARAAVSPVRTVTVTLTPSSITSTWPAATAKSGATVHVTGAVSPWSGRSVYLQRKVPGGWATERTVALTSASYRLALPTRYLGTFGLRVAVPTSRSATAATRERSGSFSVYPRWSPGGSRTDYRRFATRPRWNPCVPIRYRVNTRQAKPGALRDLRTALARVTLATGIRFQFVGSSSKIPQRDPQQSYGPGTDLLIAWARVSQSDIFTKNDRHSGRGGPLYYRTGFMDGAGRPVTLSVKGRIVLNAALDGSFIKPGSGRGLTRVALLMHEVGHVLGLLHAKGSPQIMNPDINGGYDYWGRGDLAGLRAVGYLQGCVVRDPSAPVGRTATGTSTLSSYVEGGPAATDSRRTPRSR